MFCPHTGGGPLPSTHEVPLHTFSIRPWRAVSALIVFLASWIILPLMDFHMSGSYSICCLAFSFEVYPRCWGIGAMIFRVLFSGITLLHQSLHPSPLDERLVWSVFVPSHSWLLTSSSMLILLLTSISLPPLLTSVYNLDLQPIPVLYIDLNSYMWLSLDLIMSWAPTLTWPQL